MAIIYREPGSMELKQQQLCLLDHAGIKVGTQRLFG
jgi:hypothetical protein